jgi:hypothetical protein
MAAGLLIVLLCIGAGLRVLTEALSFAFRSPLRGVNVGYILGTIVGGSIGLLIFLLPSIQLFKAGCLIWLGRAHTLAEANKILESERKARRVRQEREAAAIALFRRAVALETSGRVDEALAAYAAIVDDYSDCPIATDAESCVRALRRKMGGG